MKAILYIAHGSRRDDANLRFITFIHEVMKCTDAPVQEFGFLEHAEPNISQAIENCIAQGVKEITVIPIFLLPGIHANQDIPDECLNYPEVKFRYGKPLGVDDRLVEIFHDRLEEAGFSNKEDEVVLLVGHGSREPAAKREFEILASRLQLQVETAYLTTPVFYHEMVEKLSDKRIFILPHLLFSGGYVTKMEKRLAEFKDNIVCCRPVGFDEKLIPLIQKRVSEV